MATSHFAVTNGIVSGNVAQHQRRKVRTTVPGEGVDLLIGESGIEAAEPITVGKMFQETVAKYPTHPALRYKEGGEWKTITYSEYYNLSIKAAKAFLKVCQ